MIALLLPLPNPSLPSEPFGAEPNQISRELPCVLQKATEDPYRYAVGLRNGLAFVFSWAEVSGDWVTFHDIDEATCSPLPDFFWGRGIQVRLADICWLADCDS